MCFANNLKPAIVLVRQRVTNKTGGGGGGKEGEMRRRRRRVTEFRNRALQIICYIWSADKERVKAKTV